MAEPSSAADPTLNLEAVIAPIRSGAGAQHIMRVIDGVVQPARTDVPDISGMKASNS
ncbi:hypothetical protein [Actinophytocola sp.]|uniref:hypothetical protein n=1 Tax=Actinophytocola sp. TaxID=1872138 RepID=UPI003D6AF216